MNFRVCFIHSMQNLYCYKKLFIGLLEFRFTGVKATKTLPCNSQCPTSQIWDPSHLMVFTYIFKPPFIFQGDFPD